MALLKNTVAFNYNYCQLTYHFSKNIKNPYNNKSFYKLVLIWIVIDMNKKFLLFI